MKTKPFIFNILTVFFVGVALGVPIQIMMIYGHGPGELGMVWKKLTPFNLSVISACLVNAWYCYKSHPYLLVSVPVSIVIVGLNNWLVSRLGTDFNEQATLSATMGFAIASGSFIFTRALDAVNEPQLRWWQVPRRVEINLPVWIKWNGIDRPCLASTFDLSKTGVFISSLTDGVIATSSELAPGSIIDVEIGTDGENCIQCQATVIRKEFKKHGHYPSGMGIQFKAMGLFDRFRLYRMLSPTYKTV